MSLLAPKYAQQRPGPPPRRHRALRRWRIQAHTDAQQRPGPPPRRHETHRQHLLSRAHAQQRPGPPPRRHTLCATPWCSSTTTLNKGRGLRPGDTSRRSRWKRRPPPLNKGRGLRPGDTSRPHGRVKLFQPAQQRPGPPPRRHKALSVALSLMSPAQQRPGPPPRRHWRGSTCPFDSTPAQQRPGPPPRRHGLPRVQFGKAGVRSTKAGASAPATRGKLDSLQVLHLRSTKAGASAPATLQIDSLPALRPSSLNKGRGLRPGDTANSAESGARRPNKASGQKRRVQKCQEDARVAPRGPQVLREMG